jgi:ribose 5-phosphate isomerase B
MTIFIGADHRGYQLKDQLIEYLQSKNIRVEDLGNYEYDAQDDFPTYANKVAQAVLQNPEQYLGIVICGSGVGVCIAANRHKGIYCGLGISEDHIKHIRENDHINVLALASDNFDFETSARFVDAFLEAKPNHQKKYLRRLEMVDAEHTPSHENQSTS